MRSDNMLLLHGNNRYHVKEHEYQGTEIAANNTYRAELGLHLYGKSWQDGIPSPESPVPISSIGDSGNVDVLVTGKNLIPTNLAQDGISYNADTKRWKFEALSKYGLVNVRIIDPDKGNYILPHGQYIITGVNSQNVQFLIVSAVSIDWVELASTTKTNTSDTFTLTKDTEVGMFVIPEDITQPGYIQIQLERGSTATPYQPYREPQTLTISTPNGLCGIPVDTGGNYTDSTGQRWVCDEIDFERGVYVQRVYQVDIDGENTKFKQAGVYVNLTPSGLPIAMMVGGQRTYAISTFTNLQWFYNPNSQFLYLIADNISDQLNASCKKQLGKVYYALATPIETPLTEEELAAYKAIKSYPHYTHIESAAELKVKLMEY